MPSIKLFKSTNWCNRSEPHLPVATGSYHGGANAKWRFSCLTRSGRNAPKIGTPATGNPAVTVKNSPCVGLGLLPRWRRLKRLVPDPGSFGVRPLGIESQTLLPSGDPWKFTGAAGTHRTHAPRRFSFPTGELQTTTGATSTDPGR